MDATIGSVLPATTSISHSEQNATSAENQSQEAADAEVVTLTDVVDVMEVAVSVETEVVETPTDVEAVMADEALGEDEEIVTLTDAEAVMVAVTLEATEVAVTQDVVVTTEVAMMNALTNVIEKHVESAQATLTIVAQNQFDHVVTKGIIETIEVDLRDSRSALS